MWNALGLPRPEAIEQGQGFALGEPCEVPEIAWVPS